MIHKWVFGITKEGTPVVVGPFGTEDQADANAERLHDSQIFDLDTKNQLKATRIIKAKLESQSGSREMGRYVRSMGHSISGGGRGIAPLAQEIENERFRT